jgi:membrane-associated protease RseP (regulator of RpoE activity)
LDPYEGYEIALLVVVAYGVIVWALYRAGWIGPDRALTLLGPALMIKTKRGRALLDRWSRFRRFWTVAADVGIGLAIVAMASMVGLLLFEAGAVFQVRVAPPINEAIGIPVINPIIPLTYGIIALVVGVVLHELAHGVVARSQGIGVKTIGVLWCVIPVGAFVEQDDAEMMAASRRRRDRVAAAGVLANFALAVVFFVALSAVVSSGAAPNANGIIVQSVVSQSPAYNASIEAGDLITSLNGTPTTTETLFENAIAATVPNQTVAVVYYSPSMNQEVPTEIRLAVNPTNHTRGFLGIEINGFTPSLLLTVLATPWSAPVGPLGGALYWITLPFVGLQPIQGATAQYFHLTGPFAGGNSGAYWFSVNALYWLAWMNLLLGLSNALPLVPLDGGLLFRDFAATLAARFRTGWSEARLDEFGARAAIVSSVVVLFLLAWQLIVPHLL